MQTNTPPQIENPTPFHLIGAFYGLIAIAGEQITEGFQTTYRSPELPPERVVTEPQPTEVNMSEWELNEIAHGSF